MHPAPRRHMRPARCPASASNGGPTRADRRKDRRGAGANALPAGDWQQAPSRATASIGEGELPRSATGFAYRLLPAKPLRAIGSFPTTRCSLNAWRQRGNAGGALRPPGFCPLPRHELPSSPRKRGGEAFERRLAGLLRKAGKPQDQRATLRTLGVIVSQRRRGDAHFVRPPCGLSIRHAPAKLGREICDHVHARRRGREIEQSTHSIGLRKERRQSSRIDAPRPANVRSVGSIAY